MFITTTVGETAKKEVCVCYSNVWAKGRKIGEEKNKKLKEMTSERANC